MTTFVRHLVSKKKKRFVDPVNKFDLDLAYITEQIVASGFPASGFESLYRNPINEMKRFFEFRHGQKFKLWALTAEPERKYDKTPFGGRVEDLFQFWDHEAPPFDIVLPFCQSVDQWLKADPQNVAVIHCKAGKGRTGVMICSYLLYSGQQPTAEKALAFYAQRRTLNNKGVTIPSQKRTIYYLEQVLKNAKNIQNAVTPFPGQKLRLKKIRLTPVPKKGGVFTYYIYNSKFQVLATNSEKGKTHKTWTEEDKEVVLACDLVLEKDAKVEIKKVKGGKEKRILQFWFNTEFINGDKLSLSKIELDKAYKDTKNHKKYDPNFKVELEFENMSSSASDQPQDTATPSETIFI
jgi:phosphatidylinositol-3,4,5-trisphosphate 3-phosphatase/dual-specificity protein phosphatase PTEN